MNSLSPSPTSFATLRARIRTGIELLLSRHGTPSEIREKVLAIMEGQMNTIANLVDDLIEVSRITQDKVKLKLERIDLCKMDCSAVAVCQSTVEQRRMEIEVGSRVPWR